MHFIASPVLLSLQELPVCGDLNVQGEFDVHQVLIFSNLAGHVLLGSLQGIFQVLNAGLGISHGQLATFLCLCDLVLQIRALPKQEIFVLSFTPNVCCLQNKLYIQIFSLCSCIPVLSRHRSRTAVSESCG